MVSAVGSVVWDLSEFGDMAFCYIYKCQFDNNCNSFNLSTWTRWLCQFTQHFPDIELDEHQDLTSIDTGNKTALTVEFIKNVTSPISQLFAFNQF